MRSFRGHAQCGLKSFVFLSDCLMMVVFYKEKAYFFRLKRCNVEDDIFNSPAISDCFDFGLIGLISINLAILSNLYCFISKSAFRSPVLMFVLKKKCYSIRYLKKRKTKKNYIRTHSLGHFTHPKLLF